MEFQRRVARGRLGVDIEEMGCGHLVALSRPVELADRLEARPVAARESRSDGVVGVA